MRGDASIDWSTLAAAIVRRTSATQPARRRPPTTPRRTGRARCSTNARPRATSLSTSRHGRRCRRHRPGSRHCCRSAWIPTLRDIAGLETQLLPAIERELAAHRDDDSACAWLLAFRDAVSAGSALAEQEIATIEHLAVQAAEFATPEFDFLYDASRRLLAIGYNVTERRRDTSFYDLLASEARLSSFLGGRAGAAAAGDLVRARAPVDARRRRTGARLVERLDVRVPDAAAGHAVVSRTRCSSRPIVRPCGARSSTATSAACRGACRSPVTTWSMRAAITSIAPSACRASACSADWRTTWSLRRTRRHSR